MNKPKISTCVGLITGSLLALSAGAAQAFTFTTTVTPNDPDPTENIFLTSVEFDGQIVTDFALVNAADIVFNDQYEPSVPNSGGGSSDAGDNADGVVAPDPEEADIVASLGNLNLNNIIDTEDTGTPDGEFTFNLFFDNLVENLFFFERGLNSRLGVQAIDMAGNLLGNSLIIGTGDFGYTEAGYSIDTTEINNAQAVGTVGVSLSDLGVSGPIKGIQVFAQGDFNGPDFKVVGGAADDTTSVPEPATLVGLGLVAGAMAVSRRRKATKTS